MQRQEEHRRRRELEEEVRPAKLPEFFPARTWTGPPGTIAEV